MSKNHPLVDKFEEFSTWYTDILQKAELVDWRYNVKGMVVYRPNIMYLIRRITSVLENLLIDSKHVPVLFPAVIPISNLSKESEHIKGFENEVFKISEAGGEKLREQLVLRPTSETAIYPMYSLWIRSWKNLPMKMFQVVSVYRHETSATRPLLRGREFLWIESHDVFEDEIAARNQVKEDLDISKKAFLDFCIPFLMLEREPHDRFFGAENSYAFDTLLPDGRVLQIATTHYLGQKFSNEKVFDINFLDRSGKHRFVYQTCFGPGVSRIAASIIAIHGDSFGLILPFEAANIQIVIIPITKSGEDSTRIIKKSIEIRDKLIEKNYRVKFDNSSDTPGQKYFTWELLGSPLRLEIGKKEVEDDFVTIFRRDKRFREKIQDLDLEKRINELKNEISNEMYYNGWTWFNSHIVSISNKEMFMKQSLDSGIMRASFCGRRECAEEIKEKTGFEVRGKRIDISEEPSERCFWCENESKRIVYIAKAY
jgi:prolyl-tRNA synthetase